MATSYTLIAIAVIIAAFLLSRSGRSSSSELRTPTAISPKTQKSAKKSGEAVRGDDLPVWPFEPMLFMTNSEVRFFARLQEAMPEHFIFAQVQLSRLIQSTDLDDAAFWFNRICRMSADYVLVDRNAQTIIAVIELDDWTHDKPERQRADQKKTKAIESAGLPLIRFDGRRMPDSKQLRQEILRQLG